MDSRTRDYLQERLHSSLGTYNGLQTLVRPANQIIKTDSMYMIAVETGEMVFNGMVVGKFTYPNQVDELNHPRPFITEPTPVKDPEPAANNDIYADVVIADQIEATLKGLSLDELLEGFNVGLG